MDSSHASDGQTLHDQGAVAGDDQVVQDQAGAKSVEGRALVIDAGIAGDIQRGASSVDRAGDVEVAVAGDAEGGGGSTVLEEHDASPWTAGQRRQLHTAVAAEANRVAALGRSVVDQDASAQVGRGRAATDAEAAALKEIDSGFEGDLGVAADVDPADVKAGVERDHLVAADRQGRTTLDGQRGRVGNRAAGQRVVDVSLTGLDGANDPAVAVGGIAAADVGQGGLHGAVAGDDDSSGVAGIHDDRIAIDDHLAIAAVGQRPLAGAVEQ